MQWLLINVQLHATKYPYKINAQKQYVWHSFSKTWENEKKLQNQIKVSVKIIYDLLFDISKAFDKVWHLGLFVKLESIGITGKVLEFFKSYLTNRTQRVVVNGASSSNRHIQAGVPQGSILGPLFFLIYMS